MRVRKTQSVTIDEVQFYLSNQINVHPELYQKFLNEICELDKKHKLTLLPKTRLEAYSHRIVYNIKHRLAG